MPRSSQARMPAGEREWWITIEAMTEDTDSSHAPIEVWRELVQMPAAKYDVNGRERLQANQVTASFDVRWEINYREDMDPELLDLAKYRRVVHRGRTYDIVAATMIDRKEGVELLTLAKVG
jgi:SPP1 family predicted phage head-tail adaptor